MTEEASATTGARLPEAVDGAPFGVGWALPLHQRPQREVFTALKELLAAGVPAEDAAALRDPRVPAQMWPQVLAREVASTARWAARRTLALAGREPAGRPMWHGRGRVLTLLPAHGHAVHLIRRALPFAVCGMPVLVAGHDHQRAAVANAVARITRLLSLRPGTLETAPDPARTAVAALTADDVVVVTGHAATARTVRSATAASVLGATGGCVVLIGPDGGQLDAATAALRVHEHPGSCTRLGGVWTADPTDGPLWRDTTGAAAALEAVVTAAHPSAVYRLTGSLDDPPRDVAGYTALPCDEAGVVGTLVGFGRDPQQGWPGDFLV
ncbi:hypothetical protein HZZ00_18545 [Streptomyces sp. NEAU-sy36]|uniref:hypothetical protein n=1 Tax=unclassified Streptomyces TaxID=2593676 RepID=UPI0015D5D1C1|nr:MULTISPECIES: hypothetical protein [unclassified Streptomyces]QLJ02816.1 hypothetical protein HZZ00_18545 [Streptomyces sp. NEAU-sy36]